MLHQYVSGNFPTFGGTGAAKLQPPPRRQSGAAARQIKATAKINTANRPWRPTGSLSATWQRCCSGGWVPPTRSVDRGRRVCFLFVPDSRTEFKAVAIAALYGR